METQMDQCNWHTWQPWLQYQALRHPEQRYCAGLLQLLQILPELFWYSLSFLVVRAWKDWLLISCWFITILSGKCSCLELHIVLRVLSGDTEIWWLDGLFKGLSDILLFWINWFSYCFWKNWSSNCFLELPNPARGTWQVSWWHFCAIEFVWLFKLQSWQWWLNA